MLTVLAVGKLKEPFYLQAAAEYEKRLRAYGGVKLLELPEERLPDRPGPELIRRALKKEAAAIQGRIPKGGWLCVLTPEGRELSSADLARTIQKLRLEGQSELCFVLGSSYGMDEDLKRQARLRLSMGPMTFPHHLARIMLLEQLYRAESILAGSQYHK